MAIETGSLRSGSPDQRGPLSSKSAPPRGTRSGVPSDRHLSRLGTARNPLRPEDSPDRAKPISQCARFVGDNADRRPQCKPAKPCAETYPQEATCIVAKKHSRMGFYGLQGALPAPEKSLLSKP
jgi:hypothetical protein